MWINKKFMRKTIIVYIVVFLSILAIGYTLLPKDSYVKFTIVKRLPNNLEVVERELTNCEVGQLKEILKSSGRKYKFDEDGNLLIEKKGFGESMEMLMWTLSDQIDCKTDMKTKQDSLSIRRQ